MLNLKWCALPTHRTEAQTSYKVVCNGLNISCVSCFADISVVITENVIINLERYFNDYWN
jgi:hypothetical protein